MGCEQEGWSLQVFSLSAPQAVIILRERAACGTAAPARALHAKSSPAGQDHHRPLPRSFSTAYSYSMYTNHSLFSTVLDLACQLWHATIGTMSASTQRVSLMQQGFYFTCRGAETLTKGPVLELSVAPAGSLYYTDWLMYSDQPESTALAGKKGLNWWLEIFGPNVFELPPETSRWMFGLVLFTKYKQPWTSSADKSTNVS